MDVVTTSAESQLHMGAVLSDHLIEAGIKDGSVSEVLGHKHEDRGPVPRACVKMLCMLTL